MTDQPGPPTETSVWDLFVVKLRFWLRAQPEEERPVHGQPPKEKMAFPWVTVGAVVLAIIAQLSLEPSPSRTAWPGIVLYAGSLGCLLAAIFRGEWRLVGHKNSSAETFSTHIQFEFLISSFFLAILAFLLFGNGKFGFLNTLVWVLAVIFFFMAFWQFSGIHRIKLKAMWQRLMRDSGHIRVTRWTLIVLAAMAVILFFNFARLDSVPPEMVSDQAEKLMDVNDILHGQFPVYFTRNTGREALHFYLSAGFMRIFKLPVSFLNLKIVAVFANLLTLFFIYLLGKEYGDRWVGLAAALFAGMAYWPLLFTRLALRIPYYPLFVAPVMYFIVRGLRQQNIHDILWAGFFLGLGLHGYTPYRIVPILVVLGILIYALQTSGKGKWLRAAYVLFLIAFVSTLVFIPLLRYWQANPDLFAYRAFSRLTGMEVGFQNSPLIIFFQNFWKASVMFFWDNGVIWAHSIPRRPALEVVSGAFYFLGIASLIIRFFRQRDWRDLFLLISIPMLMMPSILSLAYPGENPSLNRSAGAVVPVFMVIGFAFMALIRSLKRYAKGNVGQAVLVIVVILLLVWSGANNYDLVFNQYYSIYLASSWNTSEIGRVAALFIETFGEPETTYVVGYPHWVDSRLVAINSGHPGLDFAILPQQISDTRDDPRSKMFFLSVQDAVNTEVLQQTFPTGVLWQYDSEVENKDFMVFFVPASQGAMP
jgi:4-amino-4-deoxy-L-arabinose transferase-like glycosyltransferase